MYINSPTHKNVFVTSKSKLMVLLWSVRICMYTSHRHLKKNSSLPPNVFFLSEHTHYPASCLHGNFLYQDISSLEFSSLRDNS